MREEIFFGGGSWSAHDENSLGKMFCVIASPWRAIGSEKAKAQHVAPFLSVTSELVILNEKRPFGQDVAPVLDV